MAALAEVGTLWLGGRLGWRQQLCLRAWMSLGQPVSLYTYGPVAGVPDGVTLCDAGEIVAADPLLRDSPAIQADLFRLYLLLARPGMIWVDADLYPLGRLKAGAPHLFGLTAAGRVGTAVLALPSDSAVLADMLAFTGDPYAVPPFLKPVLRRDYAAARAAGRPVHVSAQPRGVWGTLLLSHFAGKHGLTPLAQAVEVFYPVPEVDRQDLLGPPDRVAARITGATRAVHLWASATASATGAGLGDGPTDGQLDGPTDGSWLAAQALRHPVGPVARSGIAARADPLAGLDLAQIATLADLGGGALDLTLAAQARFDCDITLVDLTADGSFGCGHSPWVAPYLERLATEGVPAAKVRVAGSAEDLRPADLVCSTGTFGERYKVRHLAQVLGACLHADSRLLIDIRKGSGGFPFLQAYGKTEVLARSVRDGAEVVRALLRPRAPEVVQDEGWAEIARGLAGPDGFFRANDRHSFLYIPRGRTLVVTFDNLDIAMGKLEDRRPWGFAFIEKQGWSMLGVMANGWTWYRDPWVSAQFDDLAAAGFFAGFERVVFYGASMGGYAACAFCGAAPGADVVAISPQSTVDRAVVPWETRYKTVWGADFSGKYGDAAHVSAAARRISLIYDPYEPLDAGHADRFAAANVMKLRANLLGHRLGSSLLQMGILNPIILGALNGSLTEAAFYRALRARRQSPRYQRELFERLLAARHPKLARRLGDWVLRQGDNRAIRAAMANLE